MAINEESALARRYWKKYVEQPCNAVNTQGHKVSKYLDIDQQIAATPSEHIATGGLSFDNSGVLPSAPLAILDERVKKPPKQPTPAATTKGHSKKDKHGNFTHNIKGTKICGGYNQGTCKGSCPNRASHQCSKCLKNNHGAHANACDSPDPAKVKKGKGKGKGRG